MTGNSVHMFEEDVPVSGYGYQMRQDLDVITTHVHAWHP